MRWTRALVAAALIASGALTQGCGGSSTCSTALEGPAAVLALDKAGTHRYGFLADQQFVVIGNARSGAARSSSSTVAPITGSDVRAGKRYTRFVAGAIGKATVTAEGAGSVTKAQVVVVCRSS